MPLFLLQDVLYAVGRLLRVGGRWFPWQEWLGENEKQIRLVLQDLPLLLQELRYAGPFTLVEFYDPEEGAEVVLKLI